MSLIDGMYFENLDKLENSRKNWTNADWLRVASDDELAFELAVNGCPPIYPECPAKKDPEGHSNCVKCWIDWLKSFRLS